MPVRSADNTTVQVFAFKYIGYGRMSDLLLSEVVLNRNEFLILHYVEGGASARGKVILICNNKANSHERR